MQIILLERIGSLGNLGDVVTVKNGYARNFLIPQGKAKRATEANLEEFKKRRAELEAKQAAVLADRRAAGGSGCRSRLRNTVPHRPCARARAGRRCRPPWSRDRPGTRRCRSPWRNAPAAPRSRAPG